jgi:hypothetical protein
MSNRLACVLQNSRDRVALCDVVPRRPIDFFFDSKLLGYFLAVARQAISSAHMVRIIAIALRNQSHFTNALANHPKKFSGRHPEAASYCDNIQETNIALAALNAADVIAVKMREFGQLFLRKAALQPEPTDFIAKDCAGVFGAQVFIVRCWLLAALHTMSVIHRFTGLRRMRSDTAIVAKKDRNRRGYQPVSQVWPHRSSFYHPIFLAHSQGAGLLEAVLPRALKFLATDVLGQIAQDTNRIGRLLANWNVRVARDLAWDFADHVRNLSGFARDFALRSQDKLTGAIGRGLLVPIQ